MYILNSFERRSLPGRVLLAAFYLILICGAVWMVFPFLIMAGGSLKTEMDYRNGGIIPEFLTSDTALFRKFEEQRYSRIELAAAVTGATTEENERLYRFQTFPVPQASNGVALQNWRNFLDSRQNTFPLFYFGMGHSYSPGGMSESGYAYFRALRKDSSDVQGSFSAIGMALNILPEEWHSRNYLPPHGPPSDAYWRMRRQLPDRYFFPISLDGAFFITTVVPQYGRWHYDIDRLNREWETNYRSLTQVVLSPTQPENQVERAAWSEFVRHSLSPRFLKFDPRLLPDYRAFLQTCYEDLAKLNLAYGTSFPSWQEVTFPPIDAPMSVLNDTAKFVENLPDLSLVSVASIDNEWRDYLRSIYQNDIEALNRAWNSSHSSFSAIRMPILEYDWSLLHENRTGIVWEFVTRNYRAAWELVVMNGNAVRNTAIFCVLNVLAALLINPLAAYALSRFRPAWGQPALFVLLATMAFPGEVTQIPVFLHLRDLGWLNTFAALVIPGAAHGYSIFLLKGFFDSLPGELYEQATIDGCGEIRAFFNITLPLSAPVLAVIALGAFASAYGAFMFALLVCQQKSMWTLMVYIYQLQQYYHPPLVFAALVLAAIPTLLVFVFCQKVIMRGILVPLDK